MRWQFGIIDMMGKTDNLSEMQVFEKQPLVLAIVGDAVYTLYVREKLAKETNLKVNELSRRVSKNVNAKAQHDSYFLIEPMLTERELQVAKRARNTNIHSHAKNYSIEEYIYATAFEALLGYLKLLGREDRLKEIFDKLELL